MYKIIKNIGTKFKENDCVVIIDVFRATSVMMYLFSKGCKYIIPTMTVEECEKMKNNKNIILVGEESGIKPDFFDYNNSPSEIINRNFRRMEIIQHSTSGTKAFKESKCNNIYVGSFLNAQFLAKKLKKKYNNIYLYPTNKKNIHKYNEDFICAEYIVALLKEEIYDINYKIDGIYENKNLRFFKKKLQNRFPIEDAYLCTKKNIFNFSLKYVSNKIVKED